MAWNEPVEIRLKVTKGWLLLAAAVLVGGPALLVAGSVTVPHAFANDTVADAAKVNGNFGALATAVNDNDSRLDSIEAGPAYVKLGMSNYQTVDSGTVIAFDTVIANRGMTVDTANRRVLLKAGVTYKIEARLNHYNAAGNRYLGYLFALDGAGIGSDAYTMDSATNPAYAFNAGLLEFVTPATDKWLTVRANDDNIGTGQVTPYYNTHFVVTALR